MGVTQKSLVLYETPSQSLRQDFLNTYYGPGMSLGTWDPKANQVTNSLNTWILVRETDDKGGAINQEITECEKAIHAMESQEAGGRLQF